MKSFKRMIFSDFGRVLLAFAVAVHAVAALPSGEVDSVAKSLNGSAPWQIFLNEIEKIVDNIIKSEDFHQRVVEFENLQRNEANSSEISRFKRQSQLPGFLGFLGGNNAANRPPGFSLLENAVHTVNRVDQMRCLHRSVCEMMANRGIGNFTLRPSTTTASPQTSTSPFSLSNPSTLRSVLGVMQLFRFHEYAAYPFVEAALWGTSHGNAERCRTQFAACPSSSTEGLINQLNNTPGGLQAVIANATTVIRPTDVAGTAAAAAAGAPQVSAVVAETSQAAAATATATPGGFFNGFPFGFPTNFPTGFPNVGTLGTAAQSAASSASSAASSSPSSSPTPQNNFNPAQINPGFIQNPAFFGFPPFPGPPAFPPPFAFNPQPAFDPFFFPPNQFGSNFPAVQPGFQQAANPLPNPSNSLRRRQINNFNNNNNNNNRNRNVNAAGDRWKW